MNRKERYDVLLSLILSFVIYYFHKVINWLTVLGFNLCLPYNKTYLPTHLM